MRAAICGSTSSSLRRTLIIATTLAGACIEAPPENTQQHVATSPQPTIAADYCGGVAWRGGDADTTVCPGVRGCECAHPEVCCMTQIDAMSGECSSLRSCRDLALSCDGPEDCAKDNGKVCCLENRLGGGSFCRAAAECTQISGTVLCRTDTDCGTSDRCIPVSTGPLTGIMAMCHH